MPILTQNKAGGKKTPRQDPPKSVISALKEFSGRRFLILFKSTGGKNLKEKIFCIREFLLQLVFLH